MLDEYWRSGKGKGRGRGRRGARGKRADAKGGHGNERSETEEQQEPEEVESIEEGVWTPMDIVTNTMDKYTAAESSQNMDMTYDIEGGSDLEDQKSDKDLGRLVRRRTLNVKPNLESTKKRFVRREIMKNVNRFDVLRNLEEEEEG